MLLRLMVSCMMITGYHMLDVQEDDEAETAETSETLPDLSLNNVALPVNLRSNKQRRQQARHHIMDMLHDGTWRWGFPYSNHYQWFCRWLYGIVQTRAQQRQPAVSHHKVSVLLSVVARF